MINFSNVYPYNKLTKYFIEENHISLNTQYEIEKVQARDLITVNRIDLMAKWIYIDAKEKGMDLEDARELYTKHIEAFSGGKFFEPGDTHKNSIDKFFEVFDELIQDIKQNGFQEDKSLIPVGDNNVLLDGAHRCTIAAYYKLEVTVIKFPGMIRNMGYEYFRDWLLYDKYLDRMVLQYCYLSRQIYCACIWPIASNVRKRRAALDIIKSKARIVYVKEVRLNYRGLTNFMLQIYAGEPWVGTWRDMHEGVKGKVDWCYKKNKSTEVIFFEGLKLDIVTEIKKEIRELFGIDNHSVHISDLQEESCQMAELLLNKNSLHHMNYGNPDNYIKSQERLLQVKNQINNQNLNMNDYIYNEDAAMSIWGICEMRTKPYLLDGFSENRMLGKYCINDYIYNPTHYFVFEGMKFFSLQDILNLKVGCGKSRDITDISLIKQEMRKYSRDEKRERKQFYKNMRAREVRFYRNFSLKKLNVKGYR